MSIVSIETVATYCGTDVFDSALLVLHPATETEVEEILNRTLSITTHRHERYNGSGTNQLVLKNYPVTDIERVSAGTDTAFTITNDSDDASDTIVRVSVEAEELTLRIIGGVNAHALETLSFATYTTLESLVSAINSFAHGWSAVIGSTNYNTYPPSTLIEQIYFDCSSSHSLLMPYGYLNVHPDFDAGILGRHSGNIFLKGKQNIIVTYTAGYTTIPADLIYVICQMTNNLYIRHKDTMSDGLRRYSLGDITKEWYQEITRNPEIDMILSKYKRRLVN